MTPNVTYPYLPSTIPRADLSDFQVSMGTVRFVSEQEVATFDLQILDDTNPEEDEAIFVMLTGVRLVDAAQIRPGKALVMLKDLEYNLLDIILSKVS